ncbi:MAG: PD40 domain-containing protein, partial [Phaeodactylibacter sp.]|nr:PD40 domain-containing protein [Phaeodactylibacter sp.]
MRITFTLPLFLILLCPLVTLRGQVSSVEFGKNRVQFHQDYDEWSQYESRNFITYWYGEGRYIGQSVVQMAEYDFESIESILEHRMNDKIEIIVYTDLTDLKQSNIGNEETFINIGGQTKIVGNKMFVYFNGDHNNLRIQIREGIATVYLNAMLFGSNLQEIVQNAVLMNLPNWFKDGLIAFAGEEWNTTLDNELRDIIRSEQYENFTEFAEAQPRLAGQSIWYFISQNYGKSTVSNLLYLTRINRSIESGFLYVLGSTYERTTNSWQAYFEDRYRSESVNLKTPQSTPIEFKNHRNLPLTQAKISPDGKRVAYVVNEIGKYKIYIQDIETGDRKVIHKEGFRNPFQATDYNYPLIAWSPGGLELAIIYEHRDVVKILKHNVFNREEIEEEIPTAFQRIYSLEYLNAKDMVLTGGIGGQSDVYLYFSNTRQFQRITNDFWDDLDARPVRLGDQQGIIFASNRQDSILQTRAALDTIL